MSAQGVVLPVAFPRSHEIPKVHCTLIYLGESERIRVPKSPVELANNRLRAQCPSTLMVRVTGVEVFAKGHVTVMTLEDRVLKSYRQFLDKELARDGIRSASDYAFRPHVTINKHHDESKEPVFPWDNFRVPEYVWLERPILWWSSENSTH